MPTMKPRISITLDEKQHALLVSLSSLQGRSMSALVGDLIDSVEPVLGRLEGVLKDAKDAPGSLLAELRRSSQSAEDDVLSMVGGVAGGLAVRPPTSNRGVSFSNEPKKSKTYRKSAKSGVE